MSSINSRRRERVMGYQIINKSRRKAFMALLKGGVSTCGYSLSEPVELSTVHGALVVALKSRWGSRLVCRRLVGGLNKHAVFEVAMPMGRFIFMWNGQDCGDYNYALVVPGLDEFMWARNVEQVVGLVAVLGSELTGIPPLVGHFTDERIIIWMLVLFLISMTG